MRRTLSLLTVLVLPVLLWTSRSQAATTGTPAPVVHRVGWLTQVFVPLSTRGTAPHTVALTPHLVALVRALHLPPPAGTHAGYLSVRDARAHGTFELAAWWAVAHPSAVHVAFWRSTRPSAGLARWGTAATSSGGGGRYLLTLPLVNGGTFTLMSVAGHTIQFFSAGNRTVALSSPSTMVPSQVFPRLLTGQLVLRPPLPRPRATPTPTARSAPGLTPTPTSVIYPQPAGSGTFTAADSVAWQPSSISIRPGSTVTWRNTDPSTSHPVECDRRPGDDPCPWSGILPLPPGTSVTVTIPLGGIFEFRDALHPAMRGKIVSGAPGT